MLRLSIEDPEYLTRVCHALSTPLRVSIVRALGNRVLSCLELSRLLEYPLSTISGNVAILEAAGLVMCESLPARNGSRKLCSLVYGEFMSTLCTQTIPPETVSRYEVSIPVGNFLDFEVHPSCGYVVDHYDVSVFDDVDRFYMPERVKAQLLWFRRGYVEYRVPIHYPHGLGPKSVTFDLELCSEAPGFNNKQRSDVTMWLNGVEIGTWTSPSDFGDRRGRFTPAFWAMGNTQYGSLTSWCVTEDGATLNNAPLSDVTLADLDMEGRGAITMRIGVKDDAKNVGGVNIFGDRFGDYPQSIRMYVSYRAISQLIAGKS